MKIAITSQGRDLNSTIDPRFGRAKGFIIFNNETGELKYIDNTQNLSSMQGAGIQSAKNIIDTGSKVLITGNVGPKAFEALNQAGIEIMIGAKGSVADAINDYKNGELNRASGANVEGHW